LNRPLVLLSLLALAGCGSTSAPSAGSSQPPAASSGGLPVPVCPFAGRDDASAALGKAAAEGRLEGPGTCSFTAQGATASPPVEAITIQVTRHDQDSDAQLAFSYTASGEAVGGVGDKAVFKKTAAGGFLVFIKGKTTARVTLSSRSQADAKGALTKLGQTVAGHA
jgi:hypothetical protein